MKGKTHDYFPGGNTPGGFYSYYQYILGQKEAEKIICIKGGPGTGKSTFMKKIAEYFIEKGESVDYFWCSSDPDSLDGIVLREKRIAFMDGTSPHIVDPLNPGAVDTILHLGDYWDSEAIKKHKSHIIHSGEVVKQWFECAYGYLKAAKDVYSILKMIYDSAVSTGEIYKMTEELIRKELSGIDISISEGKCKKYFASAITSKGHLNTISSLIKDNNKTYLFSVPVGFDNKNMMKMISDNYIHRGFFVEEYYCPMDPGDGIEHVIIPELGTGFITLNDYHDIESYVESDNVFNIDIREYIDWNCIEKYSDVICNCENESQKLISQAIRYLANAKQEHDILEGYYIPNMNFQKISILIDEWIAKIERNEL